MKRVFFYGALFFVMASCGGQQQAAQQAASPFPVVAIDRGDIVVANEFAAELQSKDVVEIRSRATGYITKIYVAEGAKVKRGQPIVKINDDDYTQQVLSADAAVKLAKANYDNAELEVRKLKPLVEQDIISSFQLETAQSQAASAKAALNQAEHQLKSAKINRGFTLITSPVDGVISPYDMRVGTLISATELVTTVSASGDINAYFAFDEKKIDELRGHYGQQMSVEEIVDLFPAADLMLSDGSLYTSKGKVETASGIVNSNTGSLQLKAVFPNEAGALRTGSIGRVLIPIASEDVIRVPQKSTYESQDKRMVYTISADSTVVGKAITTAGGADGYFIVTDGLNEGDKILFEGLNQVREGMKIIPRDTVVTIR